MLSPRQWALRTLSAGGVTSAVGAVALATGGSWLIPSLGPSILMQCYMPRAPESDWYRVAAGHSAGILAGVSAALVAIQLGAPPAAASPPDLHLNEVVAAVLALVLTLALQIAARAVHPPAASTAMLWALGILPVSFSQVLGAASAVALVAAVGEPVRRWEARRLPIGDPDRGI